MIALNIKTIADLVDAESAILRVFKSKYKLKQHDKGIILDDNLAKLFKDSNINISELTGRKIILRQEDKSYTCNVSSTDSVICIDFNSIKCTKQ